MQLEGENEQIKRTNKQYQGELIELRSLLRKYEYEVEMMTAQQHEETELFIKNVRKPKHYADVSQRKLSGEVHLNGLESGQSTGRLDRHNSTTICGLEKGKKSALLDLPIQELQEKIASMEKTRETQQSVRRSISPDQMYSNRQEVRSPRGPSTYRERRRSPIGKEIVLSKN